MLLYRVAKHRYARSLDGEGARLYPGRWNNSGIPMIYCANNKALCALELMKHCKEVPYGYHIATIYVPDDVPVISPGRDQLAKGWAETTYNSETRDYGSNFILAKDHLLMRVPSAVLPNDMNYLMNPLCPEISRVKIIGVEVFLFDEALFKKVLEIPSPTSTAVKPTT